jgi:hypothetical protein
MGHSLTLQICTNVPFNWTAGGIGIFCIDSGLTYIIKNCGATVKADCPWLGYKRSLGKKKFCAISGTFGRYVTNLRGIFDENVKKIQNQPTLLLGTISLFGALLYIIKICRHFPIRILSNNRHKQ